MVVRVGRVSDGSRVDCRTVVVSVPVSLGGMPRHDITLTPTGALAKDASPQPVMLSLWEVEHLLGNPRSSLWLHCLRLRLNTWHFRPLYVDEVSCGQKRSFQSVPKGSQEVDLLNRRGAP